MHLRKKILLCLLLSFSQGKAEEIERIQKDLELAQKELNEQRASIAREKPSIVKSFLETQNTLQEKRRKMRLARMEAYDLDSMFSSLKQRNDIYSQDFSFIESLMRDYSLRLETFLFPGEGKNYNAKIKAPEKKTKSNAPKEKILRSFLSLQIGIERLERMIGGAKINGRASSLEGEIKDGMFTVFGPASRFISSDGRLKGIVVREKGSLTPLVIKGEGFVIDKLLVGKESRLKIDLTGGRVLALKASEQRNPGTFQKAGFWIWPILALALVSAILGMIKLKEFLQIKDPGPDWINLILSNVRDGEELLAKDVTERENHPASDVIGECLEVSQRGPELAEQVFYERLMIVENKLQSYLPFIAITAASAPLLGLLGTVSGMVNTFNAISFFGTGDTKPLAEGISEALLTTFYGLAVAIPALIFHALLARRAQGIIQDTERYGLAYVNGLRKENTKNQ